MDVRTAFNGWLPRMVSHVTTVDQSESSIFGAKCTLENSILKHHKLIYSLPQTTHITAIKHASTHSQQDLDFSGSVRQRAPKGAR